MGKRAHWGVRRVGHGLVGYQRVLFASLDVALCALRTRRVAHVKTEISASELLRGISHFFFGDKRCLAVFKS